MTDTVTFDPASPFRHHRQVWWAGYSLIVFGGLVIGAFARRRFTEPYLGVSLALILLILLGWLLHPRITLYATLFLAAVSDQVTLWWFPFAKNLSSRESISFVADALTISPLEIALYIGLAVTLLRRHARSDRIIPRTPLTWPIIAFTVFVIGGFARGLSAGGDFRIAVLEGRALFYILIVFVIVVSECTEASHLRFALWAVLAGIVVQSLLSIQYLSGLDPVEQEELESLAEHGSAIGQNLLLVTLIAFVLLGVKRPLTRWALVFGTIPTMYVFMIGQRRAGVAALVIGGAIVATAVYWRRRSAFWVYVPLVSILLAGYVAAFWSSDSLAGFPAQAVKTIIAPDSANAADQSSDLYRAIEVRNLNFTIRTDPLKGIGFGQPFYRPIPMPEINAFAVSAYVPHNSILWIWMKTGFGGFAAMFFLFGRTVVLGADRVRRSVVGVDAVVTLVATTFVVMFAVFSYVDISWDPRNTVFFGLACAICGGPVSNLSAPDANDDVAPAPAPTASSVPEPAPTATV